ncbi:MAG: translocase [Planctomycetaceae bacterium]|nr:translocase [Planctomycetaceae bacterium]
MISSDSRLVHWFKAAGRPAQARRSRCRAVAERIERQSNELAGKTDAELARQATALRWQAKSTTDLGILLPEAFALVHQASRRTLGMTYYPVQVMGAVALFDGGIVEMQTGEGKTLTALMPAFLRALPGKGCHVVTVNDYLAGRDADWSRPAFELLGLSVGCIQTPMQPEKRKREYTCDITYATAKELGFDFLRDRLREDADGQPGGEGVVQRGTYFALIDEADSILIDEARTPLIIAVTQRTEPKMVDLYRWGSRAAGHLERDSDYQFDPQRRNAWLTVAGCRKVLLMSMPASLKSIDTEQIYRQVERGLIAFHGFALDRDYVVVEDEIVIVDESTGRMMDGRKWQEGLHQAIEAKELLPISPKTQSAAQVTAQRFFRQYAHLAGMTGTAFQVASELGRTYGLKVTVIPTHRPCLRKGIDPRIFATREAKLHAVAAEIARLVVDGRAVLVGTPSVEASERLSVLLGELSVEHQILNARHHKIEAEIVSQAGQAGRVTIATNMAGRGTDIKLDPEVAENGGLHVIATEMHSSIRIDRQLIGRCARQGDRGTYQFFLSLEDELLLCLPPARLAEIQARAGPEGRGELSPNWLALFKKTQRLLERQHARQRRDMLKAEQKRTETYQKMGLDPYLEMTE